MADENIQSNRNALEQISGLLAVNQIYLDFIAKLIAKVDRAIERNRDFQNAVKTQLASRRKFEEFPRNVVTTLACYPPYFKDFFGMAPRTNNEAKEIAKICKADPLLTEERPWREVELVTLRDAVKESVYENVTIPLVARKELLINKNTNTGVEISAEEKQSWRDEIERINRRILYLRERPDSEIFAGNDYKDVDWLKISITNFNGNRSVTQLRMRWCNEEAPAFNKTEWTKEEDQQLRELGKKPWINWDVVTEQLSTSRSVYSCFARFKQLQTKDRGRKAWTSDEDEKLESLVQTLRVGDEIPWCKISTYLPGRTKEMCHVRYKRSLNRNIKHGRWTITEDLILLNGINKYGPQDWQRISDLVQNRSSLQCRDRWINVLDYKRRNRPWLWEEYERLFFGIRIFGRKNCAKIALLLPGRNNMDVKQRIFSLMRFKIAKFEEETNGPKKAEYRNIAASYMFKKDRRDIVLNKFRQFTEVINRFENNNRNQKLDNRMGIGSFMLTPDGNPVDYSVSKKALQNQFGRLITRCGRWTGIARNPNEFGSKELDDELRMLSDDKREQLQVFLRESDLRYADECKQEDRVVDNPDEAVKFYESIITPERVQQMLTLLSELMPVEVSDVMRYNKMKTRAPRTLTNKKSKVISTERKQGIKRKAESFSIENMAPKRFVTVKDRLMQQVKEEISTVIPGDQRICVLKNLCSYIRRFDDLANIEQYKRKGLKQKAPSITLKYLSQILNVQFPFPKKVSIKIECDEPTDSKPISNDGKATSQFSLKSTLSSLVPPCVGTLNGIALYQNTMRSDLLKHASRLFDAVNPENFSHTAPESSYDQLDIRLSPRITNSKEFIQLKERMYRMFFLPLIMQIAATRPEDLEKKRMTRDLIIRRRMAEENFLEGIRENAINMETLAASGNCSVFKMYNRQGELSVENDFMSDLQRRFIDNS